MAMRCNGRLSAAGAAMCAEAATPINQAGGGVSAETPFAAARPQVAPAPAPAAAGADEPPAPVALAAERGLSWCVVAVRPGHERAMARRVARVAGDAARTVIVPERTIERLVKGTWVAETAPLFPGYLIVPTPDAEAFGDRLSLITSYIQLLRLGDRPATLTPAEVERLCALVDERWVIAPSVGDIVAGELAVSAGPLKGLEGIVGKIDRHRRLAYLRPGAFPLLARAGAGAGDGSAARVRRAGAGRPPCVGLRVVSKT